MNWAKEYSETRETRSDWRQHNRRRQAQERAKRKALAERDELHRAWKKWHEERKQILMTGPCKEAAQELAEFLGRMTCCEEDASALLTLVQCGPWTDSDRDVKFLVLGLIDSAIIYMSEKEGLVPFDDPLDEPNVFLTLRKILR